MHLLKKTALFSARTLGHAAIGAGVGALTGIPGDDEDSRMGENAVKGAIVGGAFGALTGGKKKVASIEEYARTASDEELDGRLAKLAASLTKTALSPAVIESYMQKTLQRGASPGKLKGLAQRADKLTSIGVNKMWDQRPARGAWEVTKDGPNLVQQGMAMNGALPKLAFQTSMYSGPLSYGAFKQESSNPGFRQPQMAVKQAANPLTPAGRLVNAKLTGMPKAKLTPPAGPSIHTQVGVGPKIPGAGKGNYTI